MIVCDRCKNLKAKAFTCVVSVRKQVVRPPAADDGFREIIAPTVALCDTCITEVCKIIGKTLKGQKV